MIPEKKNNIVSIGLLHEMVAVIQQLERSKTSKSVMFQKCDASFLYLKKQLINLWNN